jgi:hypothetical protein
MPATRHGKSSDMDLGLCAQRRRYGRRTGYQHVSVPGLYWAIRALTASRSTQHEKSE